MSTDIAIRVEGLGKRYRIGARQVQYKTLRDGIAGFGSRVTNLLRRPPNSHSEMRNPNSAHIWALKDVSFEVKRGEVVGIIGRNGAGKSTLLRILSRITEPTEGCAEIHGRVGSLLEVGTGFHAELTGRENIYLNGAILGMKKVDIERKFDEIVAFAEIERFLDTPVKHYSSGMYVRLGFAVAAHLEPEILIVDEVLAVGDFAFQKKCLGKMGDVAKSGRTVLFVSHNMAAILNLCSVGVFLRDGKIGGAGSARAVVEHYMRQELSLTGGEVILPVERPHYSDEFRFRVISAAEPGGEHGSHVDYLKGLDIRIEYEVLRTIHGANIGFSLWNSLGICVFASTDVDTDPASIERVRRPGCYVARCHVPAEFLRPGIYHIDIGASIPGVRVLDLVPRAMNFEAWDSGSIMSKISQKRDGVIAPILDWQEQEKCPNGSSSNSGKDRGQ